MSTNKTTNYQLHSWEAGDDFLREEFNENFAKLDAGAIRIVTGTYSGEQLIKVADRQHIELGVRPKVVLVSSSLGLAYSPASNSHSYSAVADAEFNSREALQLEDTGFSVGNIYPPGVLLNCDGYTYFYIALL